MTPETPGREGTSPGGGTRLRTFLLAAVLAAPLGLALSGCGVLSALGELDTDPEEEHGSLLPKEVGWDPPPSMITSEDSSF